MSMKKMTAMNIVNVQRVASCSKNVRESFVQVRLSEVQLNKSKGKIGNVQ